MDRGEESHDSPEELTVRAGEQAGWTVNLQGEDRCRSLGHEADNVLHVQHGMLVAYCCRCSARFEMPWFRGGSAAALATVMANEALTLRKPAQSVFDDLCQIDGLLRDDAAEIIEAKRRVAIAIARTLQRMKS